MGTQITSSRRGLLGCEWRAVYVGYLTNNDDDERTGVTLKQEVVNENGIGPTRGRQWARELDGGDWNGWDVRIFVYSAKLSPPPITHSIITFMTPGNQIIRRICMFVYASTTWRVSNLAGGWTGCTGDGKLIYRWMSSANNNKVCSGGFLCHYPTDKHEKGILVKVCMK